MLPEPNQHADYGAPMRHWDISITHPSQWDDLTIRPSELRHGDLWVDPHADQLRGVVQSVARLANSYECAIQFYGFPRTWRWAERSLIRVLRPTHIDGRDDAAD